MADAICIAIVGAESTGKTTLAQGLAARLAAGHDGHRGRRVAWVPEVLREWCTRLGRTPLAHEQAPLLHAQHERIAQAAALHDIVVCDTTALMTAVYSRLVFDDRALDQRAVALHRGMALTLLTALDLPWVADGLQRDGPQVREPVDAALRELLLAHRLPFAVVGGAGAQRLERAVAAVQPLLRPAAASLAPAARGRGLFTALADGADTPGWHCECCDPAAERMLMQARRGA